MGRWLRGTRTGCPREAQGALRTSEAREVCEVCEVCMRRVREVHGCAHGVRARLALLSRPRTPLARISAPHIRPYFGRASGRGGRAGRASDAPSTRPGTSLRTPHSRTAPTRAPSRARPSRTFNNFNVHIAGLCFGIFVLSPLTFKGNLFTYMFHRDQSTTQVGVLTFAVAIPRTNQQHFVSPLSTGPCVGSLRQPNAVTLRLTLFRNHWQ